MGSENPAAVVAWCAVVIGYSAGMVFAVAEVDGAGTVAADDDEDEEEEKETAEQSEVEAEAAGLVVHRALWVGLTHTRTTWFFQMIAWCRFSTHSSAE